MNVILKPTLLKGIFVFSLILLTTNLFSQQQSSIYGIEVNPMSVEGIPINNVVILLEKTGKASLADSAELAAFYQAFSLKPGALFKRDFADMSLKVILKQPEIKSVYYKVYNREITGPITLVVYVTFLETGELKTIEGKKGMLVANTKKAFPLLLQTDRSKFTFILNGGIGSFNEENALFSKGPAFTQGNPIANDPAVEGTRYWSELYLEPGIAGITRIGKTNLYPYAAVSYLISGRNTTDIYSHGSAIYGAFERLYAGIVIPRLGKNKDINLDISAGRQLFQLNDGFLFSRYSGSSNAGERGSVYLNSRTAYQMSAIAKLHVKDFHFQAVFLEPQELFKNSQRDTRFIIGSANYNNNKNLDAGLSFISIIGSKATYPTPQGDLSKKGMYLINPKLWITNIAKTGLYLKTEYAFQMHANANMKSNAWYLGLGLNKSKWRYKPNLYYRYAYMKGDNLATAQYERFDPIQTGGLGNWVQGINFRKIIGSGNIVSHRVELKAYLKSNFDIAIDYFLLQAQNISTNLGSVPPLSTLQAKNFGHEITLNPRYYLNSHFLLMGIVSWAKPGEAITKAFNQQSVGNWSSYQLNLFMFF